MLNTAGLAYAVFTGEWRLKQMYEVAYFPIAGTMWLLGALGLLPRVKPSTKGEGHERRYFYGSVWAVTIAPADPVAAVEDAAADASRRQREAVRVHRHPRLSSGNMARRGLLPRTRPIVPGELAVSD